MGMGMGRLLREMQREAERERERVQSRERARIWAMDMRRDMEGESTERGMAQLLEARRSMVRERTGTEIPGRPSLSGSSMGRVVVESSRGMRPP